MSQLAIQQLKSDPTVAIRERLDEDTIARYQEVLDELPPIVVFDTPEGMLVADGMHRWAANERAGRTNVEADVRKGSRNDALEYAISANTRHGHELTRTEYQSAVRRLRQLHPDWRDPQVAKAINRGESFVRLIRQATEVRQEVVAPTKLSDSHLSNIRAADKTVWPTLVQAAEKRKWSTEEVRDVVREVGDPNANPERKKALLSGEAEPLTTKLGEPGIRRETLERIAAEAKEDAVGVMLYSALHHLANLKRSAPREVVDRLDGHQLERLVQELPEYIEFQQELVAIGRQRLEMYGGR